MLRRMSRTATRVVGGVAALAVVGGGAYWFGLRDDSAAAATPEVTTQTATASLTTLEKSVTASGTLTPTVQEDVSFEASGTVTAVPVEAGQTVTEGQTLATIDTLTLNADLLEAKATLATAQAKLAESEDGDDGSDAVEAQIAANAAQVDVAQAAVDDAT
jgi:multidrug efflux pump subunit AcrA (membrane-fusion protein)